MISIELHFFMIENSLFKNGFHLFCFIENQTIKSTLKFVKAKMESLKMQIPIQVRIPSEPNCEDIDGIQSKKISITKSIFANFKIKNAFNKNSYTHSWWQLLPHF